MTGGIPRAIIAALFCAGSAAVAVRSAAVEAALESGGTAALPDWASSDPRATLATELAALAARTSLKEATMRRVLDAAGEAPLEEEPFIFAGIGALLRGDEAAAEPLLEEARRRNPRARVARLLLLDLYGRQGRVGETAREMIALSRLMAEARDRLVPELARMAGEPGALQPVAAALRPHPNLHTVVLQHLAVNGGNPDVIVRLAAAQPPQPSGGEAPVWQSFLIASLLDRGDINRAVALWEQYSGRRLQREGVNDGGFASKLQLPPFGWKFHQSADGVAEAGKGGSLEVEYYGRADAGLAEQLLLLRPGARYRLSFEAASNEGQTHGSLAWKLSCRGDERPIASVPIAGAGTTPKSFAGEFTVPAGCPMQWLRLTGSSAEFADTQSARIRNIKIDAAGEQ